MLDSILSNDIKITLKPHFCRKSVILAWCMQRGYERHINSRKSILQILLHGDISLSYPTSFNKTLYLASA